MVPVRNLAVEVSRLRIAHASDVSEDDWRQWAEILDATPALHSPFLRPEFVQCVASVHDDVHVASWEVDGHRAYFPLHRDGRTARALGFGLAEWQAVVTASTAAIDWAPVLRDLGVSSLHFDHFYDWQLGETRKAIRGNSPYIDLSDGYESYLGRRKAMGGGLIQQTLRKDRKLSREHGELEMHYEAPLDEALDCLFQWKRDQHQRTGVSDAFADPSVTGLLSRVAKLHTEAFGGRLSWLTCNGRPIAVHLGVETKRAAHMWYPAYDPAWAKYSPGNILFLRLAEAMAANGIRRFDFGPGGQAYKDRLATDAETVARGVFDAHWVSAWMRQPSEWARRVAVGVRSRLVKPFLTAAPVVRNPTEAIEPVAATSAPGEPANP